MATTEREQYDTFAKQYESIYSLPNSTLEHELVRTGLRHCANARILDIGGGSALQARADIAIGASTVDVVDISQEMLNIGAMIERQEGRQGKINFLLGDVTKSLDHLGLQKASYDIVMANWVFDHATCVKDLEGMWRTVTTYIKPGGKFIGVRVHNVKSHALNSGKYGLLFEDVREITGGFRYTVAALTAPPLRFEATSMLASCSGSTEMHEKFGFKDVDVTYGERADVVKRDPEFWADMFQDPWMAFVTAVKT